MLLNTLRKHSAVFFLTLHFFTAAYGDTSVEAIFTEIYDKNVWGVNSDGGLSGSGSTLAATERYRSFLAKFFQDYNIRSVVDFGCGDWGFSRKINWEGIEYIGLDVVKSIIHQNQQKYTRPNVHFLHADGLSYDLPSADLLICKDVLQHLSNEEILQFLHQVDKFKYCLITEDANPNTQTSDNSPVAILHYRWIDLTKPPFNVQGRKVLTYRENANSKQMLLIDDVNLQN